MQKELEEIEDVLINTAGLDQDTTDQLLKEYSGICKILRSVDDDYPLMQAIRFQEICDEIEKQLPDVSEEVFEQYVIYMNLLAICME